MKIDKKVLVSLLIAVIMILSTIGFVANYSTTSETLRYNGFKFVRTAEGLRTKIDGTHYYFNFFPAQLEDLTLSEEAKTVLTNIRAISITYNPNSNSSQILAEVQFYLEDVLSNSKNVFVIKGLTDSTNYQLPEITCLNATEKIPVIELREADSTNMLFENNCIIAEALTVNEFLRVNDRILYTLLGVMN